MPTVLRRAPYRLYFFSHAPNEPPHMHVDRDNRSANFWLQPVALARDVGFSAKELPRFSASCASSSLVYGRCGMGILAPSADEREKDVRVTEETITVDLMDGRTIVVPLAWYPHLSTATERAHWQVCGGAMAFIGLTSMWI